jgi:hypothetical protein
LNHAPDFVIAADHRVELAATRQVGKIAVSLAHDMSG